MSTEPQRLVRGAIRRVRLLVLNLHPVSFVGFRFFPSASVPLQKSQAQPAKIASLRGLVVVSRDIVLCGMLVHNSFPPVQVDAAQFSIRERHNANPAGPTNICCSKFGAKATLFGTVVTPGRPSHFGAQLRTARMCSFLCQMLHAFAKRSIDAHFPRARTWAEASCGESSQTQIVEGLVRRTNAVDSGTKTRFRRSRQLSRELT